MNKAENAWTDLRCKTASCNVDGLESVTPT